MVPADQFCPTEKNCKRPEIFAFEIVNACTFLWQSFIAIRSYHFRKTPMKTFAQTPEGRVFGFSSESEMIACVSMTIQVCPILNIGFEKSIYIYFFNKCKVLGISLHSIYQRVLFCNHAWSSFCCSISQLYCSSLPVLLLLQRVLFGTF